MKKTIFLILMIPVLILTACSANASDTAGPAAGPQNGPAADDLSAPMQVAIGTIKLDGTANSVTAEQAAELLPLWQTLQVLYGSDTAANQEVDALVQQIQDTMTAEQMQAITSMNLTRQDMFSLMQSQGPAFGGAQNGNAQGGGSSTNNERGFGPGGGGFPGGPPPDGGGFPGGGQGFGGQGQGNRTQNSDSNETSSNRPVMDPNRVPTPLVQAVIDYLQKAGAQISPAE